ncbi:MAG: glycosyltransferase family 4 protein [Anaerolineae bacterium]
MKRILYIHHAGGIGGAPLSLLYLLQKLDRSRYEPVVVTLKDGPVVDLYRAEGIETHVERRATDFSHTTLEWYGGRDLWRLPGKLVGIPRSIYHLRRIVKKFEPDIVHLNSSTLVSAAIASKLESRPVVWHIREPLHSGYVGLRRAWIRKVAAQTACTLEANCQNDADQIIHGGHPRLRIEYNFVHFNMFDRSLTGSTFREEGGFNPDTPIVAMLGGVAEPKGTLTLIKALPALVDQVPDARVIVAGPPPRPLDEGGVKGMVKRLLGVDAYQKAVQRAIDALPEEARRALIFTGIRRDMPDVIAASSCVVFPSSVPHFARPVIEAAAMCVPAVASYLGGPRELIVEG